MSHKWAHEPVTVVWKQKVRIACKCGKMSPAFSGVDRDQQASEWYRQHVGLREVIPREISS